MACFLILIALSSPSDTQSQQRHVQLHCAPARPLPTPPWRFSIWSSAIAQLTTQISVARHALPQYFNHTRPHFSTTEPTIVRSLKHPGCPADAPPATRGSKEIHRRASYQLCCIVFRSSSVVIANCCEFEAQDQWTVQCHIQCIQFLGDIASLNSVTAYTFVYIP